MKKTKFAGNGLSRTAMVFQIATIAGHNLTPPQLNKVKTLNPRSLERVYNEIIRLNDADNARFALSLLIN